MSRNGVPIFPVVALGGSAGGLEAFMAFFDALDVLEDPPGWAIIVILHLPPDHDSAVAEILGNRTTLPVDEIADGVAVEPAHVYVLSPGHSVEARDGRLHLTPRAETGPHHPVDDIFASIGREYGERAVAVVCSGTGSNGSAGIPSVREGGGLVLAQDPATATYDEMPRRAIATRMVDAVLPVAEMPDVILRAQRGERASASSDEPDRAPRENPPGSAADDPLSRIIDAVRAEAAIDFRPYRLGTLERRIGRRIHIRRCADMAGYANLIETEPAEVDALVDDLLISVTGFFRDPSAWDAFEERVVTPLVAAQDPARPGACLGSRLRHRRGGLFPLDGAPRCRPAPTRAAPGRDLRHRRLRPRAGAGARGCLSGGRDRASARNPSEPVVRGPR